MHEVFKQAKSRRSALLNNNDPYNLERFIDSQNDLYERACGELRAGQKTTHWIWFIFPQMHGLGYSQDSNYFGISGIEEAVAYLKHPVLGRRLIECSQIVMRVEKKSADEIFHKDACKLKSSMTLFAQAADQNSIFNDVLQRYFEGCVDQKTLELLERVS